MAVPDPPQMNATTTPDEYATAKNGDFAGDGLAAIRDETRRDAGSLSSAIGQKSLEPLRWVYRCYVSRGEEVSSLFMGFRRSKSQSGYLYQVHLSPKSYSRR